MAVLPFNSLKKKQLESDLKINLNQKTLCDINSVKYFVTQSDKKHQKYQIDYVVVKLDKNESILLNQDMF